MAATSRPNRLWKPRLGMRRTSGMRAPSKIGLGRPAGQLALALVAAAGRLAVARAGTAADAHPLLVLVNAAIDVVQDS